MTHATYLQYRGYYGLLVATAAHGGPVSTAREGTNIPEREE